MNYIEELGLNKDNNLMHEWLYENSSSDCMDIENYLVHWYENKSKWLLPLFNNQLIIKKEVLLSKSEEILANEIINNAEDTVSGFYMLREHTRNLLFENGNVWEDFRRTSNNPDLREEYWKARSFYGLILGMSDAYQIVANEINESEKAKIFGTNKFLVCQKGVKIFRFVNYLLKHVKPIISDYDYVNLTRELEKNRLAISRILNQKKHTGTVCLSIHPMDYMTMSDNGYNWSSCMRWTEDEEGDRGCYHAGTVEMMNSPCVIVAYLEGEKEWYPLYNHNATWNNKKWRELFIVDKDFLIGVKGYPYHDANLEMLILDELAELAKNNLDWNYGETEIKSNLSLKENIIYFSTNLMYNDFGSLSKLAYKTSVDFTEIDKEKYFNNSPSNEYIYKYSSPAYCSVCGEGLDAADETVCGHCSEYSVKCNICGEWVRDRHTEYLNKIGAVCTECYEEHTFYCSCCETQHIDTVKQIIVKQKYKNIITNYVDTHISYLCEYCVNKLKKDNKIIETEDGLFVIGYNLAYYSADEVIVHPITKEEI